jgi:hypothetical protein
MPQKAGGHMEVGESAKLHKLNWRLLWLGEHCYLDSSDECYVIERYECRHRRGIKPLIVALKSGDRSAILDASRMLTSILPSDWARSYTFVPMPGSSGNGGAVKEIVGQLPVADARALLVQKYPTRSSHNGWRMPPAQRETLLALNTRESHRKPNTLVIVDDVLTTGSHFRAAKMVFRRKWPDVRVIGLFLAGVCSRYGGLCYLNGAGRGNGRACIDRSEDVPILQTTNQNLATGPRALGSNLALTY